MKIANLCTREMKLLQNIQKTFVWNNNFDKWQENLIETEWKYRHLVFNYIICFLWVGELLYFIFNNNKNSIDLLDPSLRITKITFDDLPSAIEEWKVMPNTYQGLKWTGFNYAHKSYLKKAYPNSGYVTVFNNGCSPHIAYFNGKTSTKLPLIHLAVLHILELVHGQTHWLW